MRNPADERRPDQQPDVAERGHGRDRARAAPAARARRRSARSARSPRRRARTDQRDRRVGRGRRDRGSRPPRAAAPPTSSVRSPSRVACPKKRPSGHRAAEDPGAEAADGRLGVQLALEEDRAPALDPALDDERGRADEPDQEQRSLDPRVRARAGRLRRRAVGAERAAAVSGDRDRRRRAGSARGPLPAAREPGRRPRRRGSRRSRGRARAASAARRCRSRCGRRSR